MTGVVPCLCPFLTSHIEGGIRSMVFSFTKCAPFLERTDDKLVGLFIEFEIDQPFSLMRH